MISGARIRSARRARGLTLRDVAKRVGVSHVFVSKVEHDERRVPVGRRGDFARLLGLSVADLTPLDAPTLAVVTEALREAGGCERALGVVRELSGGTS